MSDKTMCLGQLYRVDVTTHTRDGDNMIVCDQQIIMIGLNEQDVSDKFKWVVAMDADSYRINGITKEAHRYLVTSSKEKTVRPTDSDAVIERRQETQNLWQKIGKAPGRKFTVTASTVCFAYDDSHARQKLARRVDQQSDTVEYSVEELYVGDGYAKPRDVSVFPRAHIISNRRPR
jgi:hypothetical protein